MIYFMFEKASNQLLFTWVEIYVATSLTYYTIQQLGGEKKAYKTHECYVW
jgi:hypothetical protein